MNATRVLLLVIGGTCCLVAWGAGVEDLASCSALVDQSERLTCFERITQILVDQNATAGREKAKAEPERVSKSDVGKETAKKVREAAEDAGKEVISGGIRRKEAAGIAAEITEETGQEVPGGLSQDKSRDPTSAVVIPISGKSSARETTTISSDFGKRDRDFGSLTTVIVDVRKSKTRKNIYILTLDNGQVWRESQYGRGTSYRSGDRVTIKSGRMGTFKLTNRRTGFSNNVTRIK